MAKRKMVIAVQLVAEYDDSQLKPEDFGGESLLAKHIVGATDIDYVELDAGHSEPVTLTVAQDSVVVVG